MQCDFCGGETTTRNVRTEHWFKGRLYILENVEVEVCNECGEHYYHAKTLDAIDELLSREHPVKKTLEVEVVPM